VRSRRAATIPNEQQGVLGQTLATLVADPRSRTAALSRSPIISLQHARWHCRALGPPHVRAHREGGDHALRCDWESIRKPVSSYPRLWVVGDDRSSTECPGRWCADARKKATDSYSARPEAGIAAAGAIGDVARFEARIPVSVAQAPAPAGPDRAGEPPAFPRHSTQATAQARAAHPVQALLQPRIRRPVRPGCCARPARSRSARCSSGSAGCIGPKAAPGQAASCRRAWTAAAARSRISPACRQSPGRRAGRSPRGHVGRPRRSGPPSAPRPNRPRWIGSVVVPPWA
jgi:hypothetical protein